MKRFLCAFLFLLPYGSFCEPAWAEPLTSFSPLEIDPLQFTAQGSLKIDKASFDALLKDSPDAKLRVQLTDDPCLATMEAAMRAMEKWIPRDIPRSMTFEEIDKKAIDWKLWDAAKACWRQP